MGRKTPPFKEYPTWTTAKFWSFVRSGLRAKWSRWPPKYEALNKVRRKVEGKRHKWEFKCAHCGQWYKQKDVAVDHRTPAGKLNCYEDLPEFVEKLFVSSDKLDVLCHSCHKVKTAEERKNVQR